MKNIYFLFTTVLLSALQLACCGDICPSKYTLELPKPPEAWISLLGEPCWQVEWIGSDGESRRAELKSGENLEAEIPITWTNPIIARPYWPNQNLSPGVFMPAGALFPFDAKKDSIRLTWEAGHDAVFYMELAVLDGKKDSKIPANFDWPRFRELFKSGDLSEEVCKDPWLVDWRSAAEKTMSGNFDKRRLVPEKTEPKKIPVHAGPWYGNSPFAQPLLFEDEETFFPVRSGINTWFSSDAILMVNGNTWFLTKVKN
jgi:hypothetical protein